MRVYRTTHYWSAWCDGCDSEKPAAVEVAEKHHLCLDCLLLLARAVLGDGQNIEVSTNGGDS